MASIALALLARIADAVKLTYLAGRAVGWAWYRHGVPALAAAADAISWAVAWLAREIDWRLVLATVRDGLVVILAGLGGRSDPAGRGPYPLRLGRLARRQTCWWKFRQHPGRTAGHRRPCSQPARRNR